jgi:DNA-binding transcriptional ArsR family regulator
MAAKRKLATAPVDALAVAGGAPKLDRLIHERLRLGILSALSVNESLSFNELKKLLDTTDGNLSVHARKLEDAGYVSCTKSFEGRMPRTDYRLPRSKRASMTSRSHRP